MMSPQLSPSPSKNKQNPQVYNTRQLSPFLVSVQEQYSKSPITEINSTLEVYTTHAEDGFSLLKDSAKKAKF